jgi:hypothetical protein
MPAPIDISKIQSFTDQDLLTVYRYALATGGFRKSYTINGKIFEVPDAKTVMDTINWLEQRIEDASNGPAGGNIALAQFNEPASGI